MCRFLIVRSAAPCDPGDILAEFAEMARLSRAPDGDIQADGWGIALRAASGEWRTRKSLRPIWEDAEALARIPATRLFAVHARSASFPDQKNDIEFNQPFVAGSRAFVFNGLIRGVSFPRPLAGQTGAQKIWSLLGPESARGPVDAVLQDGVREIIKHAKAVPALNIGLIDVDRIAVYGHGSDGHPYYRLHVAESGGFVAVCSEPLPGLPFRPLPSGAVITV